jgi:hypothetical protein
MTCRLADPMFATWEWESRVVQPPLPIRTGKIRELQGLRRPRNGRAECQSGPSFTTRDADDRPIQFGNDEEDAKLRKREQQALLTLALLQTFHAHTTNLLSKLSHYLPRTPVPLSGDNLSTIYLNPKDLYVFELGPLSGLDAQFIEWLGEEYGSRVGVRVIVRRGWKDLARVVLGL